MTSPNAKRPRPPAIPPEAPVAGSEAPPEAPALATYHDLALFLLEAAHAILEKVDADDNPIPLQTTPIADDDDDLSSMIYVLEQMYYQHKPEDFCEHDWRKVGDGTGDVQCSLCGLRSNSVEVGG